MSCNDSNLNPNTGYYKECMRNYAANLGSHATDGCGEFTSDDSTAGGLMCAACGCHRNFHRRVEVSGFRGQSSMQETTVGSESERGGKKRVRTRFSCEQKEKMLRFAEKIGWRIQRKSNRRAEQEDDEIEQFCREVGVSRQVFKVWMHNHKNSPSSSLSH